jgi:hypothetical protein
MLDGGGNIRDRRGRVYTGGGGITMTEFGTCQPPRADCQSLSGLLPLKRHTRMVDARVKYTKSTWTAGFTRIDLPKGDMALLGHVTMDF